ncbi:hypothetical protein [Streptomyces sp. CBMA156]|nr:hypothetical protein [Streptomyces sp. CBMA156]
MISTACGRSSGSSVASTCRVAADSAPVLVAAGRTYGSRRRISS